MNQPATRYPAPLAIERVVRCACSDQYLRVDVLADGVAYLGANVHGFGGLHRKADLPMLRHRLVHAREKPGGDEWPLRIYTKWGARDDESVYIPRTSFYLLHRTPPPTLTEADIDRMIYEIEGEPDGAGRGFTSRWYGGLQDPPDVTRKTPDTGERGQCFHAHLHDIAEGCRRRAFVPELFFKGKVLS